MVIQDGCAILRAIGRVCDTVRFADLIRDREQLWAEAAHLEREGFAIDLDSRDPVYKLAKLEQDSRVEDDAWSDKIVDLMEDHPEGLTADQVMEELFIPLQHRDNYKKNRVIKTLRKNGWDSKKIKVGKKWKWGFAPKNGAQGKLDEEIIPW